MTTKTKTPRDVMDKLPVRCWNVNPSCELQVIQNRRGIHGYYHVRTFPTTEQSAAFARALNADAGVTNAQADAMLAGSIFGFDCPGADPDSYMTAEG